MEAGCHRENCSRAYVWMGYNLGSGDCHAFDVDGGGGAGSAEDEVVADGDDVFVHVFEVAGDGDLFDWVGDFAVFDPEAAGSVGVVAGDEVDAVTHGFGDVETGFDVGDDFGGSEGAGLEEEVAGADAWVARKSAWRCRWTSC